MKNIILLSGGTGVGTSRFSLELANKLGISTIASTDSIREVIRSTIGEGINSALSQSTYKAGQTENYGKKNETVQKSEIVRAFKNQCDAVNVGVEGIVRRAITENIPMIIEGVHLRPGKLREQGVFKGYEERVKEYLIYISDEESHKERFESRQQEAPDRQIGKYIDNFREIRWIHDYLFERAQRYEGISKIDNSGDIDTGLKQIFQDFLILK